MPVKIVSNGGDEELVLEQLENGAPQTYTIPAGESLELPLADDELAEYEERNAAAAAAPPPAIAPPDGVIGWACTQLKGATCTHEVCRPADVTAAAEAQLAALAPPDLSA